MFFARKSKFISAVSHCFVVCNRLESQFVDDFILAESHVVCCVFRECSDIQFFNLLDFIFVGAERDDTIYETISDGRLVVFFAVEPIAKVNLRCCSTACLSHTKGLLAGFTFKRCGSHIRELNLQTG